MQKVKVVMEYALPITVNLLLNTAISFTDVYVVAKFGDDAVSGVAIVQYVWELLQAMLIVFSSGGKVFVTRFIGQNSYKKASLVIATLLYLALMASIVLIALFFILPKVVLYFLGVNGNVAHIATIYALILLIEIPFVLIDSVIDMAMVSYGNAKLPMYLAFIAMFLNVVLDFVLAFGYFGMPKLGVYGVAIATVVSYIVIGSLHLYFYFGKKLPYIPKLTFRKKLFKRILKVAFPELASRVITNFANLFFTSSVLLLGSSYYAALHIVLKIMGIGYMPVLAFAAAGSVLFGQKVGAKKFDEAKKYVHLIAKINFYFLLLGAFVFIAFAPQMAAAFSTNLQTQLILTESIIAFALIQIPFAIDISYTFALSGAGLTKTTFKINMITLWIFRIGIGLGGIYLFHSYEIVLFAYLIHFLVTAYLMHKEFKKEVWKGLIL